MIQQAWLKKEDALAWLKDPQRYHASVSLVEHVWRTTEVTPRGTRPCPSLTTTEESRR